MATITNKTNKPLSVQLPGGKKLHLGPLKSGTITAKAVEHPAVRKLVEAGTVAIAIADQGARVDGGGGKGAPPRSDPHAHGAAIRRTGER